MYSKVLFPQYIKAPTRHDLRGIPFDFSAWAVSGEIPALKRLKTPVEKGKNVELETRRK